jgi:hypothetical protein
MTTIVLLVVVSVLIAGFSYFTNAGFGDRRPKPPKDDKPKDQASAATEEPPPHK